MPTIAVTGAQGKTGRAITAAAALSWDIRALARSEEQAMALGAAGYEVVIGDMTEAATLSALFHGVDAIYHICPNFRSDEVAIAELVANAGQGVDRLVYHSVLHPQIEAMPHHWRKMRVEELLLQRRSGNVTFLRPAPYVQNLLPYLKTALAEGQLRIPYSIDSTMAMIDLKDVGAAAGVVLADDFEPGSGWDLCGVDAISHRQVAQLLSRLTRQIIEAVQVPAPEAAPPEARLMFDYMDTHGLPASSGQLRALIGEPTTLENTLKRLLDSVEEGRS